MTDTSGVTPEVIDELKRRREERDRANAALVTQRNTVLETAPPDDAAYDLAKAKELNLPREAIAADRDRYRQEDTLARFDRLRKEAPKTSEWLAAPENFAVSRDDVDTLVSSEKELDPWLTESGGRLMSMSRTWNAFFNNVGGAARAALPGFKAQGAGLVQQQAESLSAYDAELRAFEASRDGSIQIEVGDFTLKFNPAWFGVGDQRPEAPLIARMLNLEDPSGLVLRQPGPDKFRAEARKRYDAILKPVAAEAKRIGREAAAEQKALMPQTGDFVADSLLSGVTAFINMGPAIAGFAVGGPTVGAGIMGGQVYGQVYGEGRNEYGLEPTAANERAVGHALVEAISERISLGVIDDIIKSNAPIWKKMLAGMGAEQIQEQGATLGGDVVDWATVAQEKTLGEFLAERPARMAQTALATLVASGGMQGTFLAIDYGTRAFMKDAVAAQKSPGDKLIDSLLNDASRSKLRTRAPEKAAELAGRLTEGTNAETVVIDLDGLAQSLEAAGLDITATMTEMGIPADAINETAIVMGQVEIPTSRLMVSNGIQAHRDKVQPHLRLASEDLTPAQKEVIGAEATRQAKKFSEAIAEDVARDADFAGQIAEVEEAVVTQLRDSGFSGQSSVLKANAVLASRMAAYVAKRRGQDVRDVWKEIGPTIVGQFAGAGMAQAQDIQETVLYQAYEIARPDVDLDQFPLSAKQREIAQMILDGALYADIEEILGLTRMQLASYIKEARKKGVPLPKQAPIARSAASKLEPQTDTIIDLFVEGASFGQIGAILNADPSTVRDFVLKLKADGIITDDHIAANEARKGGRKQPQRIQKASVFRDRARGYFKEGDLKFVEFRDDRLTERDSKIVEMARNGASNMDIAEEWGVSVRTAVHVLTKARRLGIDVPYATNAQDAPLMERVLRLEEKGMTNAQIAEIIETTVSNVSDALERAAEKGLYVPIKDRVIEAWNAGQGVASIAEELRRSPAVVRRYLADAGLIQKRDKSSRYLAPARINKIASYGGASLLEDESLGQSIRTSVQMPMAEVDAWVRANVTATESDMPNGDTLTVIRFPLMQDQGAPEVMLSIRLSDKNGRADVNLFLDNQMADSLESVEDPVQRGVLAKMMFAKTVMVMRQYAAEYDVKAFNFTAAESQAQGTNAKSREALYRYMLSTLKMDGYTAYEIENQTSVVNQDEAGEKTANPMLNMAGFVLVRDGVNVEEYARNEILRGSRRGRGEIVTALTAKRLGRADTGQRGGRGRGGTGPADAGGVLPADGGLAQTTRGGYSPATGTMVFTEARDLSTFMHETAHWFLDTLEKLAPTEAWAAADLAEIDAWYQSVKDTPALAAVRGRYAVTEAPGGFQITYQGQAIERPHATREEAEARIEWRERQEAFAETFEQYLQTGKASTPKLTDVFRAFRDWLVNLYRGLMPGERAALTPAIRDVFDRVLAVDTEVDAASAEAFRDADTMAKDMLAKGVITERQYKMVGERLNKAREEVKEEMIARALKEEMRLREQWWEKERARIKGELARAFDKSEVGRAFNWLAYGEWKGDTEVEPDQPVSDFVDEEYGALFQGRSEIVSEAQAVASREFDAEAERLIESTEFQYEMLDEELARLTADIDAKLAELENRDNVRLAEEVQAAYYDPAIEALDLDSETYEADFEAIEAEAQRIYDETYERLEDQRRAEEEALEDQKLAREDTQTQRLEADAIEQIETFRKQAITELVDRFEQAYGAAALLETKYPQYMEWDQKQRFVLDAENQLRPIDEFLEQRTFNPPGHGPVPPPPDVPPVRLDLRIVREQYGDEAVGKLPAAVRRRSSTSSNVTDILQQIETVRKVLAKRRKGPQTLTQFIMRRKATMADGTKEDRAWGIKGASAELKAMGLERLINEKTGRTLDYVREAAEEAGFIRPRPVDVDINTQAGDLDTTQNDLLDALAREAKGEAVVRPEDEGASKEMADARVWATWLEQNGVNIYETDKKKLKASVEAMLSQTDESLVSPDQAAEMFGFATGEELLAALAQVGNRDRFLNEQADRKMSEEFGDMMRDGTLIEEAREAARLSILGRQSEIELEALARAVGQQASANYARQMARDIIALRTVKEIAAYERDLDNERRFAKQALAAVQKGDYAGALKAKTRQLVAAQMYREGKKAHERIEKQRKDLLKYLTSESRRDKIARDYLDRIEAVLDDYELRVSKQGPSVQRERQSAAAYVAWMTEQGREAEIAPEAMLLATQASLKTWRGLTADEVEYLVGTIENLAHLGRTKQRLLNDKEKREREAILDELEATLLAAPSAKTERGKSFSPTVLENTAEWLRKAHARLTRMEFQFARLDGKEGGPLHTALFQPFADAADRETARMRGAADEMQRLYAIFTPAERNALFHRRIATPELSAPGKGLTLMDAVVIGLNWGNAGNRQALIDGYGWDGQAIEAMLNRVLNDKHWDFIEGVWALVGSYREDAFALEKSITGVAPKAVDGTTFTLANGRKIEGKYYPLKYDSGQARADSVRQARLDEKQMLNEMGKSFSKPMTKTGHLIERVGSGGKPVKLSIGVFHEHVASVIHDIAYRRAIIDVYKLVTSTRFANAYIQAAGREQYDTLVPWIAQIANERKDEPGGYVTDLLRGARRNFSIMAMGLKVGTAVQQATGVLQGVPLIGSRYAAQGFFKALGGGPASFWSAWNWVSQKSEFMRDRPMGFDRDVREVTNRLQERTPLGFVRRNAFILIGVMDTAVSTGVWIGAYDKALDGNVPGVDKADEEAAIAYADSIVRRSQVAGRIQDLPQMMRGTELEKLMTVVYSYFSGLYNETASEIMRVRGGQLNPLSFAANMTLLYVVIPLMASALAGRLFAEDDDDELDEKIGKEIASNAVSTIPFARDVINATINPQFGYQLSPAGSIIEGGTKAAANIATGEGFASEYATKQTFNLLGLLFGLPTGQLWITGEYVYDVATGQEVPADDPADAVSEALLRDTR